MDNTRSIITVFGTEQEKSEMRALKNRAAGNRNLSWSAFILELCGVRKAPESVKDA